MEKLEVESNKKIKYTFVSMSYYEHMLLTTKYFRK